MLAASDFTDFLIAVGAVSAGSAAIGGSLGLLAGALASEIGRRVDIEKFVARGGALGVLFGVAFHLSEQYLWT